MSKRILLFVFSFCICAAVFGQVDKEYSATLRRMFIASGSEESYKVVITQITAMYKQKFPNVEAKVWEEFEAEFSNTSLKELSDMLTPVYSKYMTKSDLEELIGFYETPVGKKFAQSTPLIMQESMQVGQQWGMKIAQEFEKKMREKGYY